MASSPILRGAPRDFGIEFERGELIKIETLRGIQHLRGKLSNFLDHKNFVFHYV